MATEKVCPKCKGEMTDGFVLDRGEAHSKSVQLWVEGKPEKSFWSGLKTSDRLKYAVQSYRCANCNFLEFYTTERIYL